MHIKIHRFMIDSPEVLVAPISDLAVSVALPGRPCDPKNATAEDRRLLPTQRRMTGDTPAMLASSTQHTLRHPAVDAIGKGYVNNAPTRNATLRQVVFGVDAGNTSS
jgi:hypothetical protein